MIRRYAAAGLVSALLLAGVSVSAETVQTTTNTSGTTDQTAQIQALMQLIRQLQAQIDSLAKQVATLSQNLSFGDTNSNDVKVLQEKLRQSGFFNGESTGNFGNVTLQAVKDFQNAHGIEATGFVGPQTRDALSHVGGDQGKTTGTDATTQTIPNNDYRTLPPSPLPPPRLPPAPGTGDRPSTNTTTLPKPPTQLPVTLSASQTSITPGTAVTLTVSVPDGASCGYTGWPGGSTTVSPQTTTTYGVSCRKNDQFGGAMVTVNVNSSATVPPPVYPTQMYSNSGPGSYSSGTSGGPVVVNISATPTTIKPGGVVNIVWSASPSNVQCSRSWSPQFGFQPTIGGQESTSLMTSGSVSVTCKTPDGQSQTGSVSINATSNATNVYEALSAILNQLSQTLSQ